MPVPLSLDARPSGYLDAVTRVQQIMTSTAPAPASPPPSAGASTAFAGTLATAMGTAVPAPTDTAPGYLPAPPHRQSAGRYPPGGLPLGGVNMVNGVGGVAGGGTLGQRIAALATQELGVREEPSGSNDGPRIAQYRTATANSGVGPWCSYFVSWVTAQAGAPIGENGQGEGWVPAVRTWAQAQGRYAPAGTVAPAVGDLVVFDRGNDGELDHIGIVTGVGADGSIQTVEGNSSNAVCARSYGPDGYTGLVRLG